MISRKGDVQYIMYNKRIVYETYLEILSFRYYGHVLVAIMCNRASADYPVTFELVVYGNNG
ncbi:hypothetical protein DW121_04990 [Bacteroides sp. AM10-21B]|nr:hypothetical protein DW121_04990 [Bacteroides sp. AM10-21B]